MLDVHVDTFGQDLAQDLALDLLVHDADGMLHHVVHVRYSSIALVRHALLHRGHALDVYNVALLVDTHVGGQGDNAVLAEGP